MVNTAFDSPIDAPPSRPDRGCRAEALRAGRYRQIRHGVRALHRRAHLTPSTWPPTPTGATAACPVLPPALPTSTHAWAGCRRPTSSSSPDAPPWARRRSPPTSPITSPRRTVPAPIRRGARRRGGGVLLARNVGRAACHPHHLRAGVYSLGAKSAAGESMRNSSTASSKCPRSCSICPSTSTRPAASPWPSLRRGRGG